MRALLATLIVCLLIPAAHAAHRVHGSHHYVHARHLHHVRRDARRHRYVVYRQERGAGFAVVNDPRPRAWCGWFMRHLLGVADRSFNLAANWAHWGRSGAPGVGAVVVWRHHVGRIIGQENGEWIIESGNDGHAVRTRPRSIAGAIAIRWAS